MRLARDLGMTRGELRQRMAQSEFTDWIAYYRYEADQREIAEQNAEMKAKNKRRR